MKYTQIPDTYKYEVIAEAIYGREIEHFHYDFDRINFERLLDGMQDCAYKDDLKERLADTISQMVSVEAIYDALMAQVDDQEAYAAAVERVTKKREEVKNEVCNSAG